MASPAIRRYAVSAIVALVSLGVVALAAPVQLPVVAYKMAMLTLGGMLGLALDIMAAPYAQPSSYLMEPWSWRGFVKGQANFPVVPGCEGLFTAAGYRRAALIVLGMFSMARGL